MKNFDYSDKLLKLQKVFKVCSVGLIFAVCSLQFAVLSGCQNKKPFRSERVMMGTFVEVFSADKRAPDIVFKEIERIENLLSKYKPESEISQLNRLGKLAVSDDTFYIIKKAKEFSELSQGAFDITVAPLMDLWGFTDKNFVIPKDEDIKNALTLVGSDKIILHDDNNVVEFKTHGMKIDLGGIAKGYALDCAVKKLKENGINSCLLDAGGQIYGLGDDFFGRPWRIAIQTPRGKGIMGDLELKNMSVSTSGDYEQYFEKNGKRYSHILDPRTGYPSDLGIVSVTVVAPEALTADFLSTAVFVLGKVKGEQLAKKFKDAGVRVVTKAK